MDGFGIVHGQEVEVRDLGGVGHMDNALYLSSATRGPPEVPDTRRERIEAHESERLAQA